MKITVAKLGRHQTVTYAADELMRVLKLMDANTDFEFRTYLEGENIPDDVLLIGYDGSLERSRLDDKIKIDVHGASGIITGSNERSVLIAVYRFLRELGCRWLRPGADGEFIPKRSIDDTVCVHIEEAPSYRHRAICYEGTNTFDNVKNTIEWLPRVGMNGYFIQCLEKDGDVLAARRAWETEIHKRDLLYHLAGHGFHCAPFGFNLEFNDKESPLLTPEIKKYFALVKSRGGRELVVRMSDTQFCYSNPEVWDIMNSFIVDYIKKHPDIDYLHYWLSDGENNYCECENCAKLPPADFFIDMLNDLDGRLKKEKLDTRIVFLIYSHLLWPPKVKRLNDPSRFTMMYAPITRKYTNAFIDMDNEPYEPLCEYPGNGITLPKSLSANAESLRGWQKVFDGDSFAFEYHLMWDHMLDPGYMRCAYILHRDMANLDFLGLNGMVSCQIQKVAFPTGLPQYAMAEALWNKRSDFNEVCEDYFTTAFGEDATAVREYLEKLTELFDPAFMRNDHPEAIPTAADRAEKIKALVYEFAASHLDKLADVSADWRYLYLHKGVCLRYADLILAWASEDEDAKKATEEELKRYNNEIENECRTVLDVPNFNGVFSRWIVRAFRKHTRPYGAY